MINIKKKNYTIRLNYINKNSNKAENISLRFYGKANVLNGSWKWLNDDRVTLFMDKGHEKNTLANQARLQIIFSTDFKTRKSFLNIRGPNLSYFLQF